MEYKYSERRNIVLNHLRRRHFGALTSNLCSVNVEQFIAENPDIRDEIIRYFDTLRRVGITDSRRLIKLAKYKVIPVDDVIKIVSRCGDISAQIELHSAFPNDFTEDDLVKSVDVDEVLYWIKVESDGRILRENIKRKLKRLLKMEEVSNLVKIHLVNSE